MSRIASSGEDKNPKHGLGLAVLLVDQRLDEFDDPLLPGYGRVQPAAHLDEPAINPVEAPIDVLEAPINLLEAPIHLVEAPINLLESTIDVTAQINEVLSEGVEARRRGIAKIADLGPDFGHVAVGRAGENPRRCGVLFSGLEPPLDIAEIVLPHGGKVTAGPRRK